MSMKNTGLMLSSLVVSLSGLITGVMLALQNELEMLLLILEEILLLIFGRNCGKLVSFLPEIFGRIRQ